MPTNNVYKNLRRVYTLSKEEIHNNYDNALVSKAEMQLSGKYDMVKLTSFRIGSRKERIYHYAVRGYNKPKN